MIRILPFLIGLLAAAPAAAQIAPFPAGFAAREVDTNGVRLHLRVGGRGPAVVLLHGYGETGDMWAPLAAELSRERMVIVPDLRGLGLSSRPEGGYAKSNQAADLAGLLDAERTLAQTETALAEAEAQLSDPLISLFLALGGGWQA